MKGYEWCPVPAADSATFGTSLRRSAARGSRTVGRSPRDDQTTFRTGQASALATVMWWCCSHRRKPLLRAATVGHGDHPARTVWHASQSRPQPVKAAPCFLPREDAGPKSLTGLERIGELETRGPA